MTGEVNKAGLKTRWFQNKVMTVATPCTDATGAVICKAAARTYTQIRLTVCKGDYRGGFSRFREHMRNDPRTMLNRMMMEDDCDPSFEKVFRGYRLKPAKDPGTALTVNKDNPSYIVQFKQDGDVWKVGGNIPWFCYTEAPTLRLALQALLAQQLSRATQPKKVTAKAVEAKAVKKEDVEPVVLTVDAGQMEAFFDTKEVEASARQANQAVEAAVTRYAGIV